MRYNNNVVKEEKIMLKSNYTLDCFEVLKDEGKYSEHPLERLTITYHGMFGEKIEIKLLTTVEKIWFTKNGYFECYRIEKNETPDIFLMDGGKYVLVDVWDKGQCCFATKQQVKQIGFPVR